MELDSAAWIRRLSDPNDRLATSAFTREYFSQLADWLEDRFPRVDPDLVQEAAGEALVNFFKDPDKFDASRGSLIGYLRMAAKRDLLNLLRRELRQGIKTSDPVALDELAGNKRRCDLLHVDDFPALVAVRDSLSVKDRAVYDLILQGERKYRPFAAILELTDRPAEEQRMEIKRAKDRILARFRRAVTRVKR
jgi:hypothetical protein